jgi:pimeloyl-ACP methyl ester carboxylesterase/DNA-binding CsgD family transcriptional regulator
MSLPAQQIRFCRSRDGTRIAHATCGTGPPLVWIGHWVRHLKFDCDSLVWRPWLSMLTRRHCVVRYDWRGCGLSDREGVEFSLEKHIEDLEAVVEAAGLSRFALFASGGGATMAMAYAVRHPQHVSHLALYGSQTRGAVARGMSRDQVAEKHTNLKMVELGWFDARPAYGQFFTTLHMPDASAERLRSHNELLRRTTSPANAIALLRAFFEADVLEIVPRVRCPTLVLHAREDAIIPFEEGRLVASLIPGARFVPLESRNHILQEDEPAWQQLVAELDDFLPASDRPAPATSLSLDGLTPREREVLEIVAQGLDNYAIAARLSISEKTVRNHVSVIFSKLGVNSRAQAVARARDAGLGRGNADRHSQVEPVPIVGGKGP